RGGQDPQARAPDPCGRARSRGFLRRGRPWTTESARARGWRSRDSRPRPRRWNTQRRRDVLQRDKPAVIQIAELVQGRGPDAAAAISKHRARVVSVEQSIVAEGRDLA